MSVVSGERKKVVLNKLSNDARAKHEMESCVLAKVIAYQRFR